MKPTGRRFAATALLSGLLTVLAAGGAGFAQEPRESPGGENTCVIVGAGGEYRFEFPCPEVLTQLRERLQIPAEPAPRRDIVIDPDWPHDQAMIAEHDWPHDQAMIVPRADEEDREKAAPLIEDLLDLFDRHLSRHLESREPPKRLPDGAGYRSAGE